MRTILILTLLAYQGSSETFKTEKLINALKSVGTFNETAVLALIKKNAGPALIPIQGHIDTCTARVYDYIPTDSDWEIARSERGNMNRMRYNNTHAFLDALKLHMPKTYNLMERKGITLSDELKELSKEAQEHAKKLGDRILQWFIDIALVFTHGGPDKHDVSKIIYAFGDLPDATKIEIEKTFCGYTLVSILSMALENGDHIMNEFNRFVEAP
ncbi:hypothetical protein PFISCL1PPCAC_11426, partial [Pristionchus fissidentatus]